MLYCVTWCQLHHLYYCLTLIKKFIVVSGGILTKRYSSIRTYEVSE